MQSATPSSSGMSHNDEMPSIQSVQQAGSEMNAEKGPNSVQIISSVATADDKLINTESTITSRQPLVLRNYSKILLKLALAHLNWKNPCLLFLLGISQITPSYVQISSTQ